jgi:hypothetical protein
MHKKIILMIPLFILPVGFFQHFNYVLNSSNIIQVAESYK